MIFKDDELSYSLGKQGSTRKKLEGAAGAVLEYVGHVGFIAGTLKERRRCKEWVTGNRGSELRRMEQETGTFMFMALDARGEERLIIFSHDSGSKMSSAGRMAAERLVNEMIQEKLRDEGGRGKDSRSPSRGRGRSDS